MIKGKTLAIVLSIMLVAGALAAGTCDPESPMLKWYASQQLVPGIVLKNSKNQGKFRVCKEIWTNPKFGGTCCDE